VLLTLWYVALSRSLAVTGSGTGRRCTLDKDPTVPVNPYVIPAVDSASTSRYEGTREGRLRDLRKEIEWMGKLLEEVHADEILGEV